MFGRDVEAIRPIRVIPRVVNPDSGPDRDVLRFYGYLVIFDPNPVFKQADAG